MKTIKKGCVFMKKISFITLFLALLFSVNTFAYAAQEDNQAQNKSKLHDIMQDYDSTGKKVIGIVVEAPIAYVSNETVRKLIPEKVSALFAKSRFMLLPFEETTMAVRTYREDNRMKDEDYYSDPLNRQDIVNILKPLKCDYAFIIKITNSDARWSQGAFSSSYKTTVTCDIRLLDIATNEYRISKQIIKDGKSTSVLGSPSFDRAYNDALVKALDELKIDTSSL